MATVPSGVDTRVPCGKQIPTRATPRDTWLARRWDSSADTFAGASSTRPRDRSSVAARRRTVLFLAAKEWRRTAIDAAEIQRGGDAVGSVPLVQAGASVPSAAQRQRCA